MVKLEELAYYLIDNPLHEGKIVVTDKYLLSQILATYDEIGLKKTLYISSEKEEQITDSSCRNMVLESEQLFEIMYNEAVGEGLGLGVLYLGTGIALTYLLFKPLFDLGAYWPPRYRVQSIYQAPVEDVPPEVVNSPNLIDQAGQIFSRIAGLLLGSIPLFIGLFFGIKHIRRSRRNKRLVKKIDHLKNLELEIKPNENLAKFHKDSENLIIKLREHVHSYQKAENRENKIQTCSKIEGILRRIYNISISYGCEELGSYYEDLENDISELKNTLKKPRFRRSEKRLAHTIFGESQ